MIEIEGLRKVFPGPDGGLVVLDNLSLTVGRGEVFGVIGRSGAGKSTLVRCINLIERPTAGRVVVDGVDVTRLESRALRVAQRRMGMIFQLFNLLSSRTTFGNVALPLELAGLPKAAIADRVEPLLALVGLTDKRDAFPSSLSGGQKQRVGIARALAPQPAVLLCDEATSALDPETTKAILALLKDINRKLGLTIVLITHEMSVVREICDRVAVLEHGRIAEQGSVFQIFTNPQSDTGRGFVRELMDQELPGWITRKLLAEPGPDRHPLVRFTFTGPAATDPVVSELVRTFGLTLNIVQGQISTIQGEPFGVLTASVADPSSVIHQALEHVRSRNLKAEILGHVADAHQHAA